MTTSICDIFISYRRQGGSELAQLVYKDLKRRGYRVFMDVRELRSGHFDDELRRQVGGAKDFVLLLTPDSLERCQNTDDWLRHEIALALKMGLNIVPLVKPPFQIPAADSLPTDLSELPRHNAVEYSHDKSDESLSVLVSRLRSRASWWRANRKRLVGASLAAAALLAAVGVWLGFGRLGRQADDIKRDTTEIKQKSTEIQGDTQAIRKDTTAIQDDTRTIKEGVTSLGKLGGLIATPKTAADYYHNAVVQVQDGNNQAAEEAFQHYFALATEEHYDPYRRYARLLEGNYAPARVSKALRALAEKFPNSKSAQLVQIETEAESDAAGQLQQLAARAPDFLPVYLALFEQLPRGLLIDDAARSQAQAAFAKHGGVAAFKSFVLNPADDVGADLLASAERLGGGAPFDPMSRLLLQVQVDQDITLLWAGVGDARPGRQLMLHFPNETTVTVPLNSPDNPAIGPSVRGVPKGLGSGCFVALELPGYGKSKTQGQPRFVLRANDDIRIFPHAGYLQGVKIGEPVEVQVSYIDAAGRTFRFPQPVKLFDGQADSPTSLFSAEIARNASGALVGDTAPRLQITPAASMRRIEVSGKQNGPFVAAPQHINVPTINEIHCEDVPHFTAAEGRASLWIRATTDTGKQVSVSAITVDVPTGVRWKTREPGGAATAAIGELKFVPPPGGNADNYIDRLFFSPDGSRLAARVERAGLVVWNVASGEQTLLADISGGKLLAFSSDGTRATNGWDVIDLESGVKTSKVKENIDVFGAGVSPSFSLLATVDRHKIVTLWDFSRGEKLFSLELKPERGSFSAIAVSPDGNLVAAGGQWVDQIFLIDATTGKLHKTLDELDGSATSLAFSPDGRFLLGGGQQARAWLWNLESGKNEAGPLELSNRFPVVAWASADVPVVADAQRQSLVVVNVRSGEKLAEIASPAARFAFSPAGKVVAVAGKTTIKLWPLGKP